jgi:general secretion pathway protein D
MPVAMISTSTSPAFGPSRSSSTISSGCLASKATAARVFIARIKDQIALIDIPVDSVILETQFVELTEQGVRNLGIDLNNAAGQIAVGTLTTGANLPFGTNLSASCPSAGLQAAIYAQVQKGEGRIVSRPRIAAQSGSTAKIITGDALPILTSIALSGVNGCRSRCNM